METKTGLFLLSRPVERLFPHGSLNPPGCPYAAKDKGDFSSASRFSELAMEGKIMSASQTAVPAFRTMCLAERKTAWLILKGLSVAAGL